MSDQVTTDLRKFERAIYHERQRHGANTCALHAINSLFQQSYLTKGGLAHHADLVDMQEQSHGYVCRPSENMDPSGCFSVQVIISALEAQDLCLESWNSEAMRQHHSTPHTQLAFIIHKSWHWFTLRRFGDEGNYWYNLDSTKSRPQRIKRDDLAKFLRRDGSSVFVVTSRNNTGLPHSEADRLVPSSNSLIADNEDVNLQEALHESLQTHQVEKQLQTKEGEELQHAILDSLGSQPTYHGTTYSPWGVPSSTQAYWPMLYQCNPAGYYATAAPYGGYVYTGPLLYAMPSYTQCPAQSTMQ